MQSSRQINQTTMSTKNKPAKQEKIRKLPKAAEPFKFKPGQSGNPNGRVPFVRTLSALVREVGSEELTLPADKAGQVEKLTRIKALIRAQYIAATKGSAPSAQFIADRGWGKVTQPIDLTLVDDLKLKAREMGIDTETDPVLALCLEALTVHERNGNN